MDEKGLVACMKESDLREGQAKGFFIRGKAILLIKFGGQFYGLSNRCPHMGCSFERGIVRDYRIMCPCHGWKFDIRNGQYEENSAIALESYPCRNQNGRVYIKL